jgi:hypothetical protein
MYLSEERSCHFYYLFFGLLRHVNERYGINDDPLYGSYEITDPASVREITDVLWSKEGIIDEYLKENPDELALPDIAIISAWNHHITSTFVYYGMDGEYAMLMGATNVFKVSGVACEISEMLSASDVPVIIETTLIPYDGKIIYDTIIEQMPITLGNNLFSNFRNEYDSMCANGKIIADTEKFIIAADEHIARSKAEPTDDGSIRIPEYHEFKDELADKLHINLDGFSIREDMKRRHYGTLFGEEYAKESLPVNEDDPNKAQLNEFLSKQYENDFYKGLMNQFCMKDESKTSLVDVLMRMSAKHLKAIARNHEIAGASKMKKQELAEHLAEELSEEKYIKRVLFFSNEVAGKLFAEIAKKGYAWYSFKEASEIIIKVPVLLEIMRISEENKGCIFKAPDELLAHMQKYGKPATRKKFALYKDLADYANAFANLYGMVRLDDFVNIYNEQNNKSLTKDELIENLLCIIDENLCPDIDVYHNAVVNYELSEDIEYANYIEERHNNIEMFPLTKEELLKYSDPDFYEESEERKLLYAYIIEKSSPDDVDTSIEAIELLEDLNYLSRQDSTIHGIMEHIAQYNFDISEDEMPMWIGLISAIMNSTRIWSNNGWMPKELYEKNRLAHEAKANKNMPDNVVSLAKKRNEIVGRNAPCPCGSGKKYKHCCGKNL